MHPFRAFLDWCAPPRTHARLVRDASAAALAARTSLAWLPTERFGAPPACALLPYRDPLVQACLLEGKFRDSRQAQGALGAFLGAQLDALAEEWALAPQPPRLVPVPLSAARQTARGYNQAERYARIAAGACGFEVLLEAERLSRTRDTPPQTGLGGQARRANLADAFVSLPADPHATYILCDDVTTTGATLQAAAAALRAAGARHLFLLALAH